MIFKACRGSEPEVLCAPNRPSTVPKTRCSIRAAAATLEFRLFAKTPQPRKGKTASCIINQRKTPKCDFASP